MRGLIKSPGLFIPSDDQAAESRCIKHEYGIYDQCICSRGDITAIEFNIIGRGSAIAELDERNPRIAEAISQSLPLDVKANLWGDEVYFEVPQMLDNENPSPDCQKADVSYWSPGPALCIFFGETKPYSPVNHIGKIVSGIDLFKLVKEGDRIIVNRI